MLGLALEFHREMGFMGALDLSAVVLSRRQLDLAFRRIAGYEGSMARASGS